MREVERKEVTAGGGLDFFSRFCLIITIMVEDTKDFHFRVHLVMTHRTGHQTPYTMKFSH